MTLYRDLRPDLRSGRAFFPLPLAPASWESPAASVLPLFELPPSLPLLLPDSWALPLLSLLLPPALIPPAFWLPSLVCACALKCLCKGAMHKSPRLPVYSLLSLWPLLPALLLKIILMLVLLVFKHMSCASMPLGTPQDSHGTLLQEALGSCSGSHVACCCPG